MATTYTKADDRINTALDKVMRLHHPELATAGVKVGVLLAYNPSGPAVKHHGAAARATIAVVPLKDRLTKGYDAELVIDQAECDLMRAAHLDALLDHELSHLVVKQKKVSTGGGKGKAKRVTDYVLDRDDLGRPKLKTRPGQWDAGDGFSEVVERHGDYAPEFENLRRAYAFAQEAKKRGERAKESV